MSDLSWLERTAIESPARLLKLLVERLKEVKLEVDLERHVVFHGVEGSENKVEDASLSGPTEVSGNATRSTFVKQLTALQRSPWSSLTTMAKEREVKSSSSQHLFITGRSTPEVSGCAVKSFRGSYTDPNRGLISPGFRTMQRDLVVRDHHRGVFFTDSPHFEVDDTSHLYEHICQYASSARALEGSKTHLFRMLHGQLEIRKDGHLVLSKCEFEIESEQ